MIDVDKWIERLENEAEIQKTMQLQLSTINLTERELRELIIIMHSIKEFQEKQSA